MENVQDFEDKLIVEGINSQGYGIMPKMIMQDKRLTIESKAIYAYLVSYAGAGTSAFPGLKRILSDLCISENRFYRHRKLLIDCGYISVNAIRNEKKVIIKNIYTLHSNPEKIGNSSEKEVSHKMKDRVSYKTKDKGIPQNEGGVKVTDSNINKLKLTSSLKEIDDDEKLINKHIQNKFELSEIIKESPELIELSQQLVESDVNYDHIESIIYYFYKSKEEVNLKIAIQQLNWMSEKNKQEVGISSFDKYFINGYKKRLENNSLIVADNFEEELPNIPMHNWLNNN
ncbi:helix-turn-helix domain-containing protein [Vagococcus carniphilus]|uniref:helix-turn-helix domain-containing protein n=1 Tax=Vagococcus carniphilus TaxID=218144 RepID=UPI00288DDDD5|nr:helix-turn-helix domain-containing protein [Vagococcus carniphilus]MDT2850191.1 helix-turn-helix domain-containing protein [Vagococcus carniphilus]